MRASAEALDDIAKTAAASMHDAMANDPNTRELLGIRVHLVGLLLPLPYTQRSSSIVKEISGLPYVPLEPLLKQTALASPRLTPSDFNEYFTAAQFTRQVNSDGLLKTSVKGQ